MALRPITDVVPIQAGEFRVKRAFLEGRGPIGLRHVRTMLSWRWGSILPIYCWLIDHPAGAILVDAGPRPSTHWRFPRYHPYYLLAYRSRTGQHGGLGAQLANRGMTVDEIDAIVLTHCHPDHAEGIDQIPEAPVFIEERELAHARSIRGRFWGSHPSLVPPNERVRPIAIDGASIGPFERSVELPGFAGVSLIPTPGHTAHHTSVVVEGDGRTVLIAADACLRVEQLESGIIDGVATDLQAARDTLERIDRWRRQEPLVILPSHDPDGPKALADAA